MSDNLLPVQGDWLVFLGNRFNMSHGSSYQVLRKDYSIITAYSVCVLDDDKIETWVDLVEFSLLDG